MADGGLDHLTGDGFGGGGGRVAGASALWVAVNTAGGTLGGIMKCSFSSLRS